MVKEFCDVLDAFGLTRHIDRATHILGHTLDLVLSYGFSVGNISIDDATFSDHKPIFFNVNIAPPVQIVKAPGHYSPPLNPQAATQFTDCFFFFFFKVKTLLQL